MTCEQFKECIDAVPYGKRLPTALYILRLEDWRILHSDFAATVERAIKAAVPDPAWNLLKLHTDEVAISFLSYPDFEADPHPALAEATKINLNTGTVTRTNYRKRANPPILHRKETFLPLDDPRLALFSALTKQEEEAGLYRDPSRIGLRLQWQTLLRRLRFSYCGHTLVGVERGPWQPSPQDQEAIEPLVERHRTAIKRYDLSKPVKIALDRGVLQKHHTFFDYGCGHGMDIEAPSALGYTASGWDPAFRSNALLIEADVVNLGYVLNVIEEPNERIATLRKAFALSKQALLVSTLAAGQETNAHARPYRDGFLTKTNTFQKFYWPGELEDFIEKTLEVEAITLSIGMCVVFRDADDAELFQASRSRRRIDWSQISAQLKFSTPAAREKHTVGRYEMHQELFDRFWQTMLDLGRPPELGEFDQLAEVRHAAGGLHKAINLVVSFNGESLWNAARKARIEDTLVYLAMTSFRRKFLRREVPLRIKNDVRAFFGDLNTAKEKAKDILFSAGDSGEVELAVEELTFGRYDREVMQLTFHRSFLSQLPPILRVYVHCAALRYGNPQQADLIKIHVRSGKLTFLHYRDFDTDPNPILNTRIKINLRTQFVQVFDHSAEGQRLQDKEKIVK
jgi:DNA phosphorothioation-associated putative methyltransferase